jgi:hypothetical protein
MARRKGGHNERADWRAIALFVLSLLFLGGMIALAFSNPT